ncbi:MAG: histidine kinase [Bacteroidota bacterium]
MKWSESKSIWLQVLFWGSIWALLPVLFSIGFESPTGMLTRGLSIGLAVGLAVYINLSYLLPRYFYQKKYLQYLGWCLLLIILIVGVMVTQNDPIRQSKIANRMTNGMPPPKAMFRVMRLVGPFITISFSLLGSTLLDVIRYTSVKEREWAILRNEKLETEMKFLKSQMNPHFLFNALNNIYALSVIKSDSAPGHLLKLSDMLRYVLYDCNTDKVPLGKELEYVRNFIDLNLLKDSRGLNVQMNLDTQYPNIQIAPMLFVPLIENAFKHSKIEDLEEGWIAIQLKTSPSELHFEVKNSCNPEQYTKDRVGGIGLKNVQRQLELIYPNKHDLSITQEKEVFGVQLHIQLH